jgi:hypothetical protein
MDVHINGRRRNVDEKDNGGKSIGEEGVPIGIQNSSINHAILNKPLINIEINALRIPLRKRGEACEARNSDLSIFEPNGLEMLVNLFPEYGFDPNQGGFRLGVFMEGSAVVNEFEGDRRV